MADTLSFTTLEATIKADLQAGVSWFENEALMAGSALWNILKGAFIALEPAEAQLLITLLSGAVSQAAAGATIEQIESTALNLAKDAEVALLQKTGSAIIQVIIAGIKAFI